MMKLTKVVGRSWFSLLMALVIAAMLSLGCEEPTPGPTPCQTILECSGGQVCNGGVCGKCSNDASCAKGQLCLEGLCRLGCRDDSTCDAGKSCAQGVCIGGCADGKSCPAGQTCSGGVCRAGCATRADCTGDLYCNTQAGTCQECVKVAHCKPGFICTKGTCECPAANKCGTNLCVSLVTNPSHCGLCGVSCRFGLCTDKICRLGAAQVALGATHTCALLADDGVRCWGANSSGELGDGNQESQSAPVRAKGVSNAKQLSLLGMGLKQGNSSTCALHNDGRVSCWGAATYGELGIGSVDSTLTPVVLKQLSGVIQITSGKGTSIEGKVAGFHRCALLQDGSVWCWGSNRFGEVGDRSRLQRNEPVLVDTIKNVVQVEGGGGHTCALLRDGKVWCWGNNIDGQLGIKGNSKGTFAPIDVANLENVTAIATGVNHSCAVLKSGGVKCWGKNDDGQLGDGTTLSRRTPVEVKGLTDVVSIAAGLSHTCALQRSGSVVCWGRNQLGVLGKGDLIDEVRGPVKLPFADAIQIAVGYVHTCIIRKEGQAVWCWGQGDLGQLGNRGNLAAGEPVQVVEE